MSATVTPALKPAECDTAIDMNGRAPRNSTGA